MLKKCTETDAGGSGAFLNLVSKPIFYATDIQTDQHTESHMEVAPPPKNVIMTNTREAWQDSAQFYN